MTLNFDQPSRVIMLSREEWDLGGAKFEKGSLVGYTDGSKVEQDRWESASLIRTTNFQ